MERMSQFLLFMKLTVHIVDFKLRISTECTERMKNTAAHAFVCVCMWNEIKCVGLSDCLCLPDCSCLRCSNTHSIQAREALALFAPVAFCRCLIALALSRSLDSAIQHIYIQTHERTRTHSTAQHSRFYSWLRAWLYLFTLFIFFPLWDFFLSRLFPSSPMQSSHAIKSNILFHYLWLLLFFMSSTENGGKIEDRDRFCSWLWGFARCLF